MQLEITWLYPTTMNIYGDRGNVIALDKRAAWRGIDTVVHFCGLGDSVPSGSDLFFLGVDRISSRLPHRATWLGPKSNFIKQRVADGAALLAVCGGYQLLGHGYTPHAGERLPGIGLFDVDSVAGHERFIGNIVIESDWGELVGFENHSGLTHLGPGVRPFGKVRVGRGNNGFDGNEGAVWGNAIGCYMHGSLLPKNPILADWLISRALQRKNGPVELAPLADKSEIDAHRTAVLRAVKTG